MIAYFLGGWLHLLARDSGAKMKEGALTVISSAADPAIRRYGNSSLSLAL